MSKPALRLKNLLRNVENAIVNRMWQPTFLFTVSSVCFLENAEWKEKASESLEMSASIKRTVWKNCNALIKNVIRCQFHQHLTCGFFVRKFSMKLFSAYNLCLNVFWRKNIGTNLIKCWWNWPQVWIPTNFVFSLLSNFCC